MFSKLKPAPIPRKAGVSRRAVLLAFGGRFTDELLSGLPDVLMPTIRAQFGLSYTQISLLGLTLGYVAAVVEPAGGLLIDIWDRRRLLTWGAAGIGLAVLVMGLSPIFAGLLLGYAIYGLASGPLAHTADVVLVEAHPQAPGRIFARATMLDTFGALLAPLLVTASAWLGVEWRYLLLGAGGYALVYALLIWRTRFPPPPGREQAHPQASTRHTLRDNLRRVLTNRTALTWLSFLFIMELIEAYNPFKTVWLAEQVGMSQALVGLYRAMEMGVSLVSLVFLDRWLRRTGYRRILQTANIILLVLIPAWLLLPGVLTRFVLGVPLSFLFAVYWPIGRGESLASVPGRAGALTAVYSLYGLVPIPLLFGLLAEAISLTQAMLWVSVGALLALIVVTQFLPAGGSQDKDA
jgi:MFS family permease